MKCIFFSILTTLAFYSCFNPKQDKEQSLNCYIRYDEERKMVKAEASIKEGTAQGASVEVPGGIQFQGKDMEIISVNGNKYQLEYYSSFTSDYRFSWKRGEKPVEFKLSMETLNQYRFGSDTLANSQPATLRWDGAPLQKGESMVLMWENTTTGQTVPMELVSPSLESKIEFPAAQMGKINPGKWSLYLVRKKLLNEKSNGVSMTGTVELYTKARMITIK